MESENQELIQDLQELSSKLGKSPSVKEIRQSELFESEYILVKKFGSVNKAKKIAGIKVLQENTNKINQEIEEDEELAYFLGVLAGDGSIVELPNGSYRLGLTCKDQEMLDKFSEIGKNKLGIEPVYGEQKADGKIYSRVDFCSKGIGDYFGDWSFDQWPETLRSEFGWAISDYPEAFISGIFDAEGTIKNNRYYNQIYIYCQNSRGKKIISRCLDNIGISNSVNQDYVAILSEDREIFNNKVKPVIERKRLIEA